MLQTEVFERPEGEGEEKKTLSHRCAGVVAVVALQGMETKKQNEKNSLPRTPTVDELLLFHTGAPELVVQ